MNDELTWDEYDQQAYDRAADEGMGYCDGCDGIFEMEELTEVEEEDTGIVDLYCEGCYDEC